MRKGALLIVPPSGSNRADHPHAGAERTRAAPDREARRMTVYACCTKRVAIQGGAEYRSAPACGLTALVFLSNALSQIVLLDLPIQRSLADAQNLRRLLAIVVHQF